MCFPGVSGVCMCAYANVMFSLCVPKVCEDVSVCLCVHLCMWCVHVCGVCVCGVCVCVCVCVVDLI